jgi:YD repeat-containing protein
VRFPTTLTNDGTKSLPTVFFLEGMEMRKNPQDEYLTSGVKEDYAYDGVGRRTAETRDPEGLNLMTSFTYDPEGRLTRTTRPDGKHFDSTYDYAGNRLTFADEKTRTTSYVYDNESRLIRVEAPAQAPVAYVYDDAGNMLYIEVNDDEYRPVAAVSSDLAMGEMIAIWCPVCVR